jgi:uncharacterized protein
VTPVRYECRVTHARHDPVRNVFGYPMSLWLVDVDALPGTGFQARDHFGDPSATIRSNVDSFLAARGVDPCGWRILMLAQPRVLGYVFNPLSVFWCLRPDGPPLVIAEVHNTYGERHCYLMATDERGRARTAKEFYVSPFYPVDGAYRMSLPLPGERLDLNISLHREGERPFVAGVRGRATAGRSRPWSTLAVSARIRRQGIGLYLRGLRVVPRPRGGSFLPHVYL